MSDSIFKNAGTNLRNILESYDLGEILYTSIDVAKYNHSAMVVNFFGDIIIPKFDFPYNNHGIKFLRNKIKIAQKQTQAKKLFLGLESTGHYHENLVASLAASGYDVQVIRPIDSKNERDNVHAKTDAIDLAAIAKVIISNKGKRSHIPGPIYYNLQRASRIHRQLIWQETRAKNIITSIVDKTFTGLWNQQDSIFSDKWGKASLLFIENYPTPQQVIKLGVKRLANFFRKHDTKLGMDTANKIIQLAKNTPARSLEMMESDIKGLKSHAQVLRTLMSVIFEQKKQMIKFLLQTPGTYLLSVPGIGIVYAADFTAEVDKSNLSTSHKGKNHLRVTVNQIALSLNSHCPEYHSYYSKKHYQYKDASGKARTATANKFIKLAFAMMKDENLYYPRTVNPLNTQQEHYQRVWDKMKKRINPYLCDNIPRDNYLTRIQRELEEKYGIKP